MDLLLIGGFREPLRLILDAPTLKKLHSLLTDQLLSARLTSTRVVHDERPNSGVDQLWLPMASYSGRASRSHWNDETWR